MTINQTITQARTSAGLSRQELAQAIGYEGKTAYSNIRRYEEGERNPGPDLIERIALATGCRIYTDGEGWSIEKPKRG